MDEIERKRSQKQKEQWREYVDNSLNHPLDNRHSSQEGFGRDNQDNIKNILRSSKPCQQWDAQTQGYINVTDNQENIGRLEKEEVTNPKHYDKVGFGIQPLEYIIANELDFLEGNIIKYVSRYPHKGGVNDLLKARTYIEKLIERERIKNE